MQEWSYRNDEKETGQRLVLQMTLGSQQETHKDQIKNHDSFFTLSHSEDIV